MLRKLFLYLFVAISVNACMPVQEEVLTEVKLDLKDSELIRIYNFQDQRATDSLYRWFRHRNPTYRYASAMALASVQDDRAIDSLAFLLKDKVEKVQIAAAYAIGQIANEAGGPVLINAFQRDDSLSNSVDFNKSVLEAVGKCASEEYLNALASISTYTRHDTILLEGQALGIYRYALRDKVSEEGTAKMIAFLSDKAYPESVKFIAANYLARAKDLNLSEYTSKLILAYDQASDPRIRMALAIALGKTKDPNALQTFLAKFRSENDYRVKCNMIRAFANFDYAATQPLVFEALKDKNPNLAQSAADYLVSNGFPADATIYFQMARDSLLDWRIQMTLYRAANKHLPLYMEGIKGRINQDLRIRFQRSANVYEKAAALMGLSEFGWNYRFIKEQGFSSTNPVVRTATANALVNIAEYPNFNAFFGLGRNRVQGDLASYFVEAVQSTDVSMIAILAEAFVEPRLNYKAFIDSTGFMEEALVKLELPRDIEIYNELQNAISYFKGLPAPEPITPKYNHPIDWKTLEALEDDTRVLIETSKGNMIVLEFMPQLAPGSVANFINLSRSGSYDGEKFHRVVPNFVIQGGCPRGDGFGGEDYTIRTEVPLFSYNKEGYVGMASSGKDTESTQWFITHSPALHLDGKYSAFAKVVEGMEFVHEIVVGDAIVKITILNK